MIFQQLFLNARCQCLPAVTVFGRNTHICNSSCNLLAANHEDLLTLMVNGKFSTDAVMDLINSFSSDDRHCY
jgi:hypothetical protein